MSIVSGCLPEGKGVAELGGVEGGRPLAALAGLCAESTLHVDLGTLASEKMKGVLDREGGRE